MVGHDYGFSSTTAVIKFQGELPQLGVKYKEDENNLQLQHKSLFILETVQDRPMVSVIHSNYRSLIGRLRQPVDGGRVTASLKFLGPLTCMHYEKQQPSFARRSN